MKKLFASCLIAAASLSAMAAESSITYTYATDECGYWGKGKSEIYDVAIRINDPALAGKKITGIRAVLNAYEGIESTSVWLSKNLTLEKIDGVKVNVPDVLSVDVQPEKISMPGDSEVSCGQLSTTLENPYVLTEEGIYVGYTLTVPKVEEELTDQQKYPLLLSPSNNPESLYLRASKDFLKWVAYNGKLGAAAMIYVTLEGEFAEYSVGIKNLASAYAPQNEAFALKATISNIGSQDVSSLGYTYSVDGQSFDRTLEFPTPLAPNFVSPYKVEFPIDAMAELGNHNIELKITKVNGADNDNSASAASAAVAVLPFVPKHRPMVEEFTGTWCGWCTRGYYALEALNEAFGDDVVLAAYHNGNPMEVTSKFPVNVAGFPSASLNRNGVEDPYYGTANDGFGLKNEVVESIETVVPADIQVKASWEDAEKTKIKVETSTKFFEDKDNAGYKVGYLLINNGLCGNGGDWNQSNYYAGSTGYAGTDLEVLTTWPSSVPDLVFNDVVVDVNGMLGVDGSVPESISYDKENTTEYSFDIADNKVIQDKEKLYVAAYIIKSNGTILNANKAHVETSTAVAAIDGDATAVSTEFFNLSGSRVANPQEGIFVKVVKMSDGTIRTSKIAR